MLRDALKPFKALSHGFQTCKFFSFLEIRLLRS